MPLPLALLTAEPAQCAKALPAAAAALSVQGGAEATERLLPACALRDGEGLREEEQREVRCSLNGVLPSVATAPGGAVASDRRCLGRRGTGEDEPLGYFRCRRRCPR